MIINYLKIAWRSLWKHKAYSLINIAGLSIGLTACLIVATVVIDELSYDHQWSKGDDIYRVLSVSNDVKGEKYMPMAFSGFAPCLKREIPGVKDYCRMSVGAEHLQLGNGREGVAFKNLRAEPNIWNLLDFKVTLGDPHKYIKGYVNLIITEKIRQQYFKDKNPIGEIITSIPQFGDAGHFLITGVIDKIPTNTHLRSDIITIAEYRPTDNVFPQAGEGYTFEPEYVLLRHGTDIKIFTQKVNRWYAGKPSAKEINYTFGFQPMKDVYLRSDFNSDPVIHGSIRNVYIFAGVAALLLIIACINFVNLTISRVFNRAKETGIRKVLGAQKIQLIVRFLSESFIFFVLSFVLAIFLYPLFLKPVESYLDHQLVINLSNAGFLITAICSVFIVSLLSGLYPAWFLSRPQPIVILRNKMGSNMRLNILKKALVVGQFVISVTIIIVTLIVHNQLSFMNRKDVGFDKNNLLNVSFTMWGTQGPAFKQSVKELSGVESVSITNWWPSAGPGDMSMDLTVPGQKEKITAFYIEGDADLPTTLKLRLKSGRIFNPNLTTDAMDIDSSMNGHSPQTKALKKIRPYLATNFTASMFGIKVNKPVTAIEGTPVGILEDFNSESLHTKLHPTFIIAVSNEKWGNMLIRIKAGSEKQVISAINTSYKKFYPEKPFEYNWVDELINDQYKTEYKLQQLFSCFSILIVFLACLGLFGLVSFAAEQRVKEIGIRKVLGAGVSNIVALISKDYLALVVIAIIIASPIAWYAMNKWLQDFAYRINIEWWVFALSGVVAALIAFITISFQSVKAALANPVKSLKNE
jgi:putative ABC transport system permease protein